MDTPTPLDLAIIGGGPAGMSAALVAGRARLDTVIVNAEQPRNAVTTASHGFLTRDGAHPTELLSVAKEQLRKYDTVEYVVGLAAHVSKGPSGFDLTLADGRRLSARRVLLATGFRDDLSRLGLPGIEEVYGKSVYPCPFCDGYEHRDEKIAVFGADVVEHFVPLMRIWSEDIVVFSNGAELAPGVVASMETRGVRVVTTPVARLVSDGGALRAVELSDGTRIEREAGFVADDFSVPATNFAEALGVGKTQNAWDMEVPDVSETGKSKVPGVYVIGDARTGFGGLIAAAGEGAACVAEIVHEIAQERWE